MPAKRPRKSPKDGTDKQLSRGADVKTPIIYGYARVSTAGQTLDPQIKQLKKAGATIIFRETVSSGKASRAELRKVLNKLEAGDVLIVTQLDRLARSTIETLNMLDEITAKGAGFRSLGDAWADTTTAQGRLIVTFISGFAEFERSLIKRRTSEGIARARERGVKFGPKFKLDAHQQHEAITRRKNGEVIADIARSYRVSHSTISRLTSPKSSADTEPQRRKPRVQA
jgi:DNA invertase Pin-like site-specific DNA recombinase